MITPDIQVYNSVMAEINRRFQVIQSVLKNKGALVYDVPKVETIYLQLRMILELIALGSLAANKEVFESNQKKFHKHWNPVDILRDIETMNPGFFPKPMVQTPPSQKGMNYDLSPITEGFLTKKELIKVHGRCGNILHARNPYAKSVDIKAYEAEIVHICRKIHVLLSTHVIELVNDPDHFYFVFMNDPNHKGVWSYTFERRDPPPADASF